MRKLIECASCGGLKRVDSLRCPHCRAQGTNLLKRSLAAAGFGAIAACCPSPAPCTPEPLGACLPIEDSGPTDSGTPTDGGSDGPPSFVGADAYGIAPLRDSGTDGPDLFMGLDAYGADAGLVDAGLDSGNDDD